MEETILSFVCPAAMQRHFYCLTDSEPNFSTFQGGIYGKRKHKDQHHGETRHPGGDLRRPGGHRPLPAHPGGIVPGVRSGGRTHPAGHLRLRPCCRTAAHRHRQRHSGGHRERRQQLVRHRDAHHRHRHLRAGRRQHLPAEQDQEAGDPGAALQAGINSVITFVLYKRVSPLLHR